MKQVRIATRGSRLAIIQAEIIADSLRNLTDDIEVTLVTVTTKGDCDTLVPQVTDFLHKSDARGVFTSGVETALLEGRADLAVHSLKDLPTAGTPDLLIAAIPAREYPADALVTSKKVDSLKDLPTGAFIGTSSPRRIALLRHFRSDLKIVPLRGNVETRVRKVESGDIDAAVLAYAGLNRLGLADKISAVLAPDEFLPAPGQGALAIQAHANNTELITLVSQLDDKISRVAVQAERYVLAAMHGGCRIPLGAYARVADDKLTIDAMIADLDGKILIKRSRSSTLKPPYEPSTWAQSCAQELAEELLSSGGSDILNQIRKRTY
jgi:hydroxymethylbilane synthase